MPYLKPAYEDQDHFICERVLEFRNQFMRTSSQSAEEVTHSTVSLAEEDMKNEISYLKTD
jgi:hypothetical protein